MKKKLEADLISIAHRILKLKNKSELVQLHQETQKLYEKLSVLLFVEENFGDVKPTIGYADIEKKIEEAFDAPAAIVAVEEEPQAEIEAEVVATTETESEVPEVTEPVAETIEDESIPEVATIQAEVEEVEEAIEEVQEETVSALPEEEKVEEPVVAEEPVFRPAFELAFESKIEDIKEEVKEEQKNKSTQITFDDLLGPNYSDPVFVKPEELENRETEPKNVIPISRNLSDSSPVISINKDNDSRTVSLNDRLSKGITIGLNDRIAFMKHLFANSSEDYNRVLSQLITFDTFQEVQSFIDDMVKPDYNNWEGKEEYEARFMEILEKRFS
jgi:hypothetical protein